MKIVVLSDSVDNQCAGIHVYTKHMIEALQAYDENEIICIRNGKRKDIVFDKDIIVKPIFGIDKDPFRMFFLLPRLIRKLNPDIVIEPAHFGPFHLPEHIKRVTIIHDLTPILFPQWHNRMSSKLQKWFLPGILKNTHLVVTNSENTRTDVLKEYNLPKNKVVSIYPGIDDYFRSEEVDKLSDSYFLTTGTIEPRKNLITLLDAYKLYRDNSEERVKLFIVGGKGWKSDLFYDVLNRHPYKSDIELKGYVSKSDLRMYYQNANAFIYPSYYEGFGFPVAEALSVGAHCIVSRSSSLVEVGGEVVDYFDPDSVEELSEAMMRSLKEESQYEVERRINDSREHLKQFSWKKYAKRFVEELMEL